MPAKKKPNAFFDTLGGGAPKAPAKVAPAPQPAQAPKGEGRAQPKPRPTPVKKVTAPATPPVKAAGPAAAEEPKKKGGRKRVVEPGWVPVSLMLDPQLRDRLNMICRLKKVTLQETLADLAKNYVDDNMDFLRKNI